MFLHENAQVKSTFLKIVDISIYIYEQYLQYQENIFSSINRRPRTLCFVLLTLHFFWIYSILNFLANTYSLDDS
jgi:hypothetical protein